MGGGLLSGLNTALSALEAQQSVISVTANNVANVSTPGYSREVADLQALPPASPPSPGQSMAAGEYGTGVQVSDIQRLNSRFLNLQQWGNDTAVSGASAQSQTLGQVEAFFNEPSGTGLSSTLDAFWNGWQSLSDQPTSTAARSTLVAKGQSLVSQFNALGSELSGLRQNLNEQVGQSVTQINQLTSGIAALNAQISSAVGSGLTPGSLQDARSQMVDKLAQLVPVQVNWSGEDSMTVAVGGIDAVAGTQSQALQATPGSGGMLRLSWAGGGAATIQTGKLGALLHLRDQVIGGSGGYMAQLDTMASQLITAVNTQHAAGYDLQGNPGQAFFEGTSAESIAVNPALQTNPSLVAAAASAAGVPGDGSNALAVSQLQNKNLAGLGQNTVDQYYTTMVGQLGSASRLAQNTVTNGQSLQQAISNQQQQISGVSINGEMTKMVEAQNAYAAAAKVTVTINTMLGDLIQSV